MDIRDLIAVPFVFYLIRLIEAAKRLGLVSV